MLIYGNTIIVCIFGNVTCMVGSPFVNFPKTGKATICLKISVDISTGKSRISVTATMKIKEN